MQQITDPEEAKAQRFRNSEWGPEATESMIAAVRDFPTTFGGGTLGDILDATPKDVVSKVMLEEKLFDTWHHGNVVLIGDAVHKMLPTSGQGAINAMQDAVVLANCIYDLEDLKPESLDAAFESYKQQRHGEAKKQVNNSAVNAKISSGQVRAFLSCFIRLATLLSNVKVDDMFARHSPPFFFPSFFSLRFADIY